MRNLKITLSYDGTNFNGWQIQKGQKHVRTVQKTLEQAIEEIFAEKVKVIAAGRTDAGVHALGQVINFLTNSSIPFSKVPDALNSVLPKDVVALKCELAHETFHARFDAVKKWYRYVIDNGTFPCVLSRRYSCHVRKKLDYNLMKKASGYFKGEHDFRAFCSAGSSIKDSKRAVYSCRVSRRGSFIFIDITANGFLYNMVRIIAGTLIEVGRGKIAPEELPDIIESGDRKRAGPTAPACGLCLVKVLY